MAKILEKLYASLALGTLLMLGLVFLYHGNRISEVSYWGPFFTYLHVLSAIAWIGLLYYFNLVQIPTMPKIPADMKPAIGKFIAPEALFWFRWAALATIATGLLVAKLNGYEKEALTLDPAYRVIGTGMWLGIIMVFNVWFIIWPNQKKALGIVKVEDLAKAKAARVAMLTSRVNFVLSIPMLYCMVAYRLLG